MTTPDPRPPIFRVTPVSNRDRALRLFLWIVCIVAVFAALVIAITYWLAVR